VTGAPCTLIGHWTVKRATLAFSAPTYASVRRRLSLPTLRRVAQLTAEVKRDRREFLGGAVEPVRSKTYI
jgi:hypothetical protein